MRNLARTIPIGAALFLVMATADADPPGRVGRLSLVEGEVTVLDTRDDKSEPATINWPVTGGTAIVTARGARAEVRVGSTAVRIDGATDVEFAEVDDEATQLRLGDGTVNVRVRDPDTAARFTLDTPQARVQLAAAGRYRFDANPRVGTAVVTVFQGSVQVSVGGATVSVASGRRAEIGRHGGLEIAAAFADGFDDWALARDRGDDLGHSTRYVSPEMTGAEALPEYGDWRETPEYGAMWFPRAVPVGWAPYRTGRWAWIAPWGWTWVDEAPWGFAPFHYGRWALVGGVWGWAPGVWVARPVFAPALVGWIGSPVWSVSVSIGVPAVGWFPLAPREVFFPAFPCSPVFVRKVNVTHVTNAVHAPRHFAHRHVDRAVTVVPASAVTHGQPVGRSHLRVRHDELAARAAGASNVPPETVARPPQRSADARRGRDDDRGFRRPQEIARPAPSQAAPVGGAATPPGDRRPIPDRALREDRERRGEVPQARMETRGIDRPVAGVPPVTQPSPNGGPPPRPVERAAPVPQPAPNVAGPPGSRAPERGMEPRPPVAARPDRPLPTFGRGPVDERSRGGEQPRRLERQPEPARVERPVERARPSAPMPQAVIRPPVAEARREVPTPAPVRPPAAEVRRDVPMSAPAVRGAAPGPQVVAPQRSFGESAESRGDRGRGDGGRGERQGGQWRGGERR